MALSTLLNKFSSWKIFTTDPSGENAAGLFPTGRGQLGARTAGVGLRSAFPVEGPRSSGSRNCRQVHAELRPASGITCRSDPIGHSSGSSSPGMIPGEGTQWSPVWELGRVRPHTEVRVEARRDTQLPPPGCGLQPAHLRCWV